MRGRWTLALLACGGAAAAQTSPYRAGDRVELQASGDHWQQCTVTDPGSERYVMRMQCDAYSAPGYSRGAGVYTETITSTAVRRARSSAAPRPAPSRPSAIAAPQNAGGAQRGEYRVGQAVEIEASKHWVPCVVSEITGAGPDALIRVRCPEYPALARAAGTYIVHNNQTGVGIRPATGRIGREPTQAARAPTRSPAPVGTTLIPGEYTCYGSGMRILYGLGFKVTGPGRYTDLEGRNPGTFTVANGSVAFRGGHLGGQVGRDLRGKSFRIGAQASCELWG